MTGNSTASHAEGKETEYNSLNNSGGIYTSTFSIEEIEPYINWTYFFYAWRLPSEHAAIAYMHDCPACNASYIGSFTGIRNSQAKEALRLYHDAKKTLSDFAAKGYGVKCVFMLAQANSKDEDIIIFNNEGYKTATIPFLRQQTAGEDGYCLCMSDFILPADSGKKDKIGIFAVSADKKITDSEDDSYKDMLNQTLADRLAEAGAELLHLIVRKDIWAYQPDECLSMKELHNEAFVGIRPAVGYPSMPDISINFILDNILDFSRIDVCLTENGMMTPHASVSGLMISHPRAKYFNVGKISMEQLNDYSKRRGLPADTMEKYLSANLLKV